MTAPQFAVITDATRFEELVATLPAPVAQKYRDLEEQRDAAHGALVAALTRAQDAHRDLVSAQAAATIAQDTDKRDVDRFNRQRQSGAPEPPSPRAVAALAALDRARDREGSRRQARDEAQAAWEVADRLLAAVHGVLGANADPSLLVPVVVERRGPKAPREAAVELERVRGAIATIAAELQALDAAPVPLAEAAARLDDYLDGLAQQWEPPVAIDFAGAAYRPPAPETYWPYRPIVLLAALAPLRAALHARLTAAYATLPAAVATADRAPLRARLLDRRRQAELVEEGIVLEAELAGITIRRREDASPDVVLRAVLGGPTAAP
jgi:hypothetical protein